MYYQVSQEFESFEAFNSFSHGWDAHFETVCPEEYRSTLRHSAAQGILINTASYTHANLQQGSTPAGMRTFALSLSENAPLLWRGIPVDASRLMVFPADRELHAVAGGAGEVCTLSIETSLVTARLEDPTDQLFAAPSALTLSTPERASLLRVLEQFSEFLVRYGTHRQFPEFSRGLQEHLLDCLLAGMPLSEQQSARVSSSARQVQRALELVELRLSQPLAVAEIARDIGCHRRTLELGFRKYLGIAPKQYIRQRRLRECRRRLQAAAPGTTVSDIALACGFWHMGQFGKDYKYQFGELPSATLRNRKPKVQLLLPASASRKSN